MNCLGFALKYWDEDNDYRIWYNSDHAINIHKDTIAKFEGKLAYIPITKIGFEAIYQAHKKQLDAKEVELLEKYFKV